MCIRKASMAQREEQQTAMHYAEALGYDPKTAVKVYRNRFYEFLGS